MTVSTTNTDDTYTSDGATTSYAFSFQILTDAFGNPDASTVDVYFNSVEQTTGFTVLPNNDQESSPGGTVQLTGAQPVNTPITLQRNTPAKQLTTFGLSARLSTPALEAALDSIVMIAQEAGNSAGIALALANALPGVSTTIPTPVGGAIPAWNGAGTAIANIAPVQAHYVLTDNGPNNAPTFQASAGGGGGSGVFGPATSTPFALAVWNNNSGTSQADGPAIGTAGQFLNSNGAGQYPSFTTLPLLGPASSTANTLVLWDGTTGGLIKDGPTLPQVKGLPLISGGNTGGDPNEPVFSAPPPNASYLAPAPHRRAMWWQLVDNASLALVATGAAVLTVTAGTTTKTNSLIANVGKFLMAPTPATLNALAGWVSATLDQVQLNFLPTFVAHIYTYAVVTNQRIWIGLATVGMVNASGTGLADTFLNGLGFRFSTAAGDTTWKAVAGTGAAQTVVDTGVAVAASTDYRMFIDASTAGTVYYWINETLVATITTNLPTGTSLLGPIAQVKALAAQAVGLAVGKIYVDSL